MRNSRLVGKSAKMKPTLHVTLKLRTLLALLSPLASLALKLIFMIYFFQATRPPLGQRRGLLVRPSQPEEDLLPLGRGKVPGHQPSQERALGRGGQRSLCQNL